MTGATEGTGGTGFGTSKPRIPGFRVHVVETVRQRYVSQLVDDVVEDVTCRVVHDSEDVRESPRPPVLDGPSPLSVRGERTETLEGGSEGYNVETDAAANDRTSDDVPSPCWGRRKSERQTCTWLDSDDVPFFSMF